jgi:hypothetical protein
MSNFFWPDSNLNSESEGEDEADKNRSTGFKVGMEPQMLNDGHDPKTDLKRQRLELTTRNLDQIKGRLGSFPDSTNAWLG